MHLAVVMMCPTSHGRFHGCCLSCVEGEGELGGGIKEATLNICSHEMQDDVGNSFVHCCFEVPLVDGLGEHPSIGKSAGCRWHL